MNKTLEKILEDELFENQTFEGEGSLSIKHTSEGTKMPITLIGNTIQDGEPSPENPVELRHLADDINMFDEQWTNSSTTSTSTNFIPVFKDEYCIYSQDNEGSAVNYHFYETKESTVQSIYADANTGFTPPSNGFVKLSKRLIPEGTKCKLQKGKKGDITPYSSYGKGTVKIQQCAKNHFDISKITNVDYLTNNGDGTLTLKDNINTAGWTSSGRHLSVLCPNLRIGQRVVVSFSSTSKMSNKDNFYLSGADYFGTNGHAFTVTEKMLNSTFCLYGGYNEETLISNIQVEDEISTEYEPYQGQDTVIQTKPLRSLPNWVHDEKYGSKTIRRVGKIILDGTEEWYISGTNYYITAIKNLVADCPSSTKILALCTHFNVFGFSFIQPDNLYFHPNKNLLYRVGDKFTSLEEWKAFLAEEKEKGTPVTVYYELAEPVVEEDTENKLANLTAYDGQTNIACTSEIPCGLRVDAKISKIKKLEEQINAQGGV